MRTTTRPTRPTTGSGPWTRRPPSRTPPTPSTTSRTRTTTRPTRTRTPARRPAALADPRSGRPRAPTVDGARTAVVGEVGEPVDLAGEARLDGVDAGVRADRVDRQPRAVVRDRQLDPGEDEPRLGEGLPRVAVGGPLVEGEAAEDAGARRLGPRVDVAGLEQLRRRPSDRREPVAAGGGQGRRRAAADHQRVAGRAPHRARCRERVERRRERRLVDRRGPADQRRRGPRARPFHTYRVGAGDPLS